MNALNNKILAGAPPSARCRCCTDPVLREAIDDYLDRKDAGTVFIKLHGYHRLLKNNYPLTPKSVNSLITHVRDHLRRNF